MKSKNACRASAAFSSDNLPLGPSSRLDKVIVGLEKSDLPEKNRDHADKFYSQLLSSLLTNQSRFFWQRPMTAGRPGNPAFCSAIAVNSLPESPDGPSLRADDTNISPNDIGHCPGSRQSHLSRPDLLLLLEMEKSNQGQNFK